MAKAPRQGPLEAALKCPTIRQNPLESTRYEKKPGRFEPREQSLDYLTRRVLMSLLNWPNLNASDSETTGTDATTLLHAERALLSPLWIASLAVLSLNDHLLKGSGILPDVLTGKISDVAGMLVAPALLAALTRTKSRRGLFLCHLAVGAVFAAINLSADAASAWSALMGLTGTPWQITVDPSDLLVLPALFLSWKALLPSMKKPVPRARVRALEGSLAAAGLCFSVATSEGDPWGGEGEDWWTNPVIADTYVQNISDVSTVVRIRQLREDVEVDCFELAASPGTISEEVFGPAQAYTLDTGNVAALRDTSLSADCYAVLLEGDTFPQTLVFWEDGDIQVDWIEGDEAQAGGLLLDWDGDRHTIEARKTPELIQELADPDEPPAGACMPQEDGARLAWTRFAGGDHRIAAIDVGPDGCLAIDFSDDIPDG
ncbi:MAG TPA: hypothetical protein ENK31_09885, partial [Nannocystis exedens]|nr:hypothetical protein [Nannocystis exedens]